MRVSILGVIVGGFVDVVLSVLLGLPLALYSALKVAPSQRVGPHASDAISAAIHADFLAYSAQLIIGLLCSVLGGYIAATIAKRHERLNGTLSCYLCVSLGILGIVLGLSKDPLWFQALLMISSPALAFVGGDLRHRQKLARRA